VPSPRRSRRPPASPQALARHPPHRRPRQRRSPRSRVMSLAPRAISPVPSGAASTRLWSISVHVRNGSELPIKVDALDLISGPRGRSAPPRRLAGTCRPIRRPCSPVPAAGLAQGTELVEGEREGQPGENRAERCNGHSTHRNHRSETGTAGAWFACSSQRRLLLWRRSPVTRWPGFRRHRSADRPRMGRKPKTWTAVDRDYETLRIGVQTLFRHVGIEAQRAAA